MDFQDEYKCNRDGKGYRIIDEEVIVFEGRQVFLKSNTIQRTNEKFPKRKAGTTNCKWNETDGGPSFSALGNKRKVDGEGEKDQSTDEIESKVKRVKDQINDANNSCTEEEETSVEDEDSLFSNDLLLRTIFSNLTVRDLKSCRQVNRLWNLEATKILLKRECVASIRISDGTVAFLDAATYNYPISLQDFRAIMDNSVLFPTASFGVGNGPLSQNITHFFRDHGPLVKSFSFHFDESVDVEEGDATSYEILQFASMHFPNLQKLKIVKYIVDEPPSTAFLMAIENSPEMKNLQTLELKGFFSEHVVYHILRKATKLKNIYFHRIDFGGYINELEKLVKLGNAIPRLKNIHWLFMDMDESPEIYKKVLEQNPQFSTLETIDSSFFDDLTPINVENGGRFLTAMLHQCSESLTEILGVRCLRNIPEVRFPVLPNVKRLEVQTDAVPLFINLSQVFPNLTTYQVEGFLGFNPDVNFSEPLRPVLSVRHL